MTPAAPAFLNRDKLNAVFKVIIRNKSRLIAAALCVLGTIVMLLYDPFNQSSGGDSAGYDYIAQSILRGKLPYRDVVEIKTPLSVYLSAAAMATGSLFGIQDVVAVRLFQAVITGLLLMIIFLTGRRYLLSTGAALLAAVFPLTSPKFAEWTQSGTQPKLSMILFGIISLLLIAKNKPFWAGVSSILSFLCWQPGLMFTGVAFLFFSNYLTSWRDGRALKVVLGAVVPLIIVLGYFYWHGALRDLWAWTISFTFSVFRVETQREPLAAVDHMWIVTGRVFGAEAFVVLIGIAGFVAFALSRIRSGFSKRTTKADLFRDAVLFPPAIYFGFCVINMQGGPDLIPFFPFIGFFGAWLIVWVGRFISSRSAGRLSAARLDLMLPGAALIVLLSLAAGRGLSYSIPPDFTLQRQMVQFKEISNLMGPDDTIYVHGSVELLVLLKKPNLNAYPFMNQGIDVFAAARRSIDLNTFIDEMKSAQPKVVALSRLRTVRSRDLLQQWVGENYDRLESFTASHVYVRRGP